MRSTVLVAGKQHMQNGNEKLREYLPAESNRRSQSITARIAAMC